VKTLGSAQFPKQREASETGDEKDQSLRFGRGHWWPRRSGDGLRQRIRRWIGRRRRSRRRNTTDRNGIRWLVRAVATRAVRLGNISKCNHPGRGRFSPDRRWRRRIGSVYCQVWHHRFIQNFALWLGGCRRFGRKFRNAIAAPRARKMRAIGQERFANMKRNLFPSPINAVGHTVGDIDLPVLRQVNHVGRMSSEVGIVSSGNWVMA